MNLPSTFDWHLGVFLGWSIVLQESIVSEDDG